MEMPDILWTDDIPTPIFILDNTGELSEVAESLEDFHSTID